VPIFINGLGQDYNTKFSNCGKAYPGMHWVRPFGGVTSQVGISATTTVAFLVTFLLLPGLHELDEPPRLTYSVRPL
jgi:hypothetical protein